MDNNMINNAANLDIKSFKNEVKNNRLEAAFRSTSLKETDLKNDANMASKRKADWSSLHERADQIHVRQARMDLEDLEKRIASKEASRTPRFTEGQMEEAKVSSANKGFWIGTLLTAAVGGYFLYKRNKSHKEEIELLERRIEDLKKTK